MDEVEAVEGVSLVLDPAVHMRAADLAGVSLDSGGRIDNLQLVAVFQHRHIFAWHDGAHREGRPAGLPAFGTAARVVVGDITLDADFDRFVPAFANKCTAGKATRALLDAVVDRWVDMNSHGPILL